MHVDAGMLRAVSPSHLATILTLKRGFSRLAPVASGDYDHFYRYTSGRWIHDEPKQLALRYCRFNVDGLKRIVASAGNAKNVTRMVKLAEGAYNKVFLISLDNSKDIIARIKTPHAGPPHLVTASEVATIQFVRSLGIPTPAILDWSSQAEQNPAEAEYIIMEKAAGVELSKVWPNLSETQKNQVILKWVELEKSLMISSSGGHGSLYHRADLEPGRARDLYVNGVREPDLVIGPCIDRRFWTGERLNMELDRGPWDSPLAYYLAIANNARLWIENYAVRPAEFGIFDPPENIQHPDLHVSLLNKFIAVAPFLVPQDLQLTKPTLWLHDIHLNNVFVSEECLSGGDVVLSSVIDWQHISILPLYLQADVSALFRYSGGTPLPAGDSEPLLSLPDDFDTLDEEDKVNVKDDIEQANRFLTYKRLCAHLNPEYYRALTLPTRELIFYPVKFANNTWDNNFMLLRDVLGRIYHNWEVIVGRDVPCPIHISEQETQTWKEEALEWQQVRDGRRDLDGLIGVADQDGWVSNDEYEGAVSRNAMLMKAYVKIVMAGKSEDSVARTWPYRPS
ncbi:phosphotransferase family protein [Neolentinus lepideus HHB14362 ss-1]|uniref:Altered inheritance of mitochondria protein 9, mitochondrial n=1 Tax=Neolentinus lepideus HHB14362 ss-1 TaxID=1314782 RepID=A0A165SXR6_9AGAM|nr:phosphotransferase family protein [Neolentinus lepideus HHB14362 ss-1]